MEKKALSVPAVMAELEKFVDDYLCQSSPKQPDLWKLGRLLQSVSSSERADVIMREGRVAGYTILHRAIKNDHIDLVEAILSAIPQSERLDILSLSAVTPLHVAARVGSIRSVNAILSSLTGNQQKVLANTATRAKGAAQQTPLEWVTEVSHKRSQQIMAILKEAMSQEVVEPEGEADGVEQTGRQEPSTEGMLT